MAVLVLGGTGFIGAPLVRRLMGLGVEVVAVHRGLTPAPAGVEAAVLDRADGPGLKRLARARRATAVIDLIAYHEAQTRPVLAALAGEIERYVVASSADVYRNYGGLHRLEVASPTPGPLSEAAPLRTRRFPYRQNSPRPGDDAALWMDDYDKIPVEAAARETLGLGATVVRLPMVFGPGDRNRRFGWLTRQMAEGRPFVVLDAAWAAWRTSYGFVEDVAAGLALAALHPRAGGQTFNLGPLQPPDHRAWAQRFAQALDWRGDIRLAPAGQAPMSQALADLDLRFSLALDSCRIRDALGYDEPTTLDQALALTLADELSRPRPRRLEAQYAAEDAWEAAHTAL